ncbi:MAG TPA: TIR domain-containing protein, partial [Planctomycetota bacterium]|nr:TIR domain-containing protein [Planctomycetota bacterium]
ESRNPRHRMSRDSEAITQGVVAPPHIKIEATLMEERSYATGARKLSELAEEAMLYMQKKLKMKGKSVAKTDGKVFIGHGRSKLWLELKGFLQDKLRLTVDEYNLESAAGLSRKERLEAMLEDACFAFLVMTAEDQQADGSLHARENVVHEVGLFQGRLGFERAIVLLEDGCNEFSNIEGLGQVRFEKGKILSKTEEIRDVLQREKIIR